MPMFRERPAVVEARQFDGTAESAREIIDWIKEKGEKASLYKDRNAILLIRKQGLRDWVTPGYWVLLDEDEDFLVYSPDVFVLKYEEIPNEA